MVDEFPEPPGDGGADGGTDGDADGRPDDTTPLAFGVEGLDARLGAPLRPGSVVALSAAPASPSEELLYPPAAANPGRYLTTLRGADRSAWARTSAAPRSVVRYLPGFAAAGG